MRVKVATSAAVVALSACAGLALNTTNANASDASRFIGVQVRNGWVNAIRSFRLRDVYEVGPDGQKVTSPCFENVAWKTTPGGTTLTPTEGFTEPVTTKNFAVQDFNDSWTVDYFRGSKCDGESFSIDFAPFTVDPSADHAFVGDKYVYAQPSWAHGREILKSTNPTN